jgi:DNA (cytosine-5)-methyltransferase 1
MAERPPMLRASFLRDDELVVDLFAGGGGASTGVERALGRVDIAINHSPAAIAAHRANHPRTRHFLSDVWEVDPREACGGRPVGCLWASPDCADFSLAKGGKPRRKKIRSLAWVVTRWARDVRPRVIIIENVPEFAGWGPLGPDGRRDPRRVGETFRAFVRKLERYDYVVEFRTMVAAKYGAPTLRNRIVLVARCDRLPIVWPAPTHGPGCDRPYRTAAEIIDWSLPCPSIFARKRPLAEATLRRIAAGLRRYVLEAPRPFVVKYHGGADRNLRRGQSLDEPLKTIDTENRFGLVAPFLAPLTHQGDARVHDIAEPVRTVTAAHRGELALLAPTLVQTGYGEREGQAPRALDLHRPLGTVVACGQKHALVAAFLSKHYGGVVGHAPERPLGTVTARDHHAVTTAWLTKFYGTSTGADVRDPLPTVTSGGGHGGGHLAEVRAFLVKYYQGGTGDGRSQQQSLFDPLHTITTKARFGLVAIEGQDYQIADIGMRMLQPHELFAAQGFPPDYVIAPALNGRPITKTQQIELAGNSVCPPLAEAVARANFGDGERAREVA